MTGRTRRTACGSARRYEILRRCADANTLAVDADGKDLATCDGGGFFYTSSRTGLNEQRNTTAATRSTYLSAKSTGFPRSRNDAVHGRSRNGGEIAPAVVPFFAQQSASFVPLARANACGHFPSHLRN